MIMDMKELSEALSGMDPAELALGAGFVGVIGTLMAIGALVWFFLSAVGYYKMFQKAGQRGWFAFIPLLREYGLFRMAWTLKAFIISTVLLAVVQLGGDSESVIAGLVVAVVGILLAPILMRLVDCPEACFDGAVLYLQICIAAAPITLLYNYGAAILRTMGETQRPLFYISVSGIANVVLNIILCFVLEQKVAAVAIATVASKLISAALVFHRLCHLENGMQVSVKKMRFDFQAFKNIIRFGIPTSISNLLFPIANLQVVPAINSFGVDAVAGNGAGTQIHQIMSAFTSSFSHATTTFMGQNIGACNKERVKKSFWYCLGFGFLITAAFGTFFHLTGRFWLGLILGKSAQAAIDYGMIRLFVVTQFTFISLVNNVLLHALQAYGYPFFGSISSIFFTLGFRVLWMQLLYPRFQTFEAVMACFVVSWALNAAFNAIFVAVLYRRYNKGIYKKI
jgi:Na+-driven multidrug efflux pump